jgi:hypothetical protein
MSAIPGSSSNARAIVTKRLFEIGFLFGTGRAKGVGAQFRCEQPTAMRGHCPKPGRPGT